MSLCKLWKIPLDPPFAKGEALQHYRTYLEGIFVGASPAGDSLARQAPTEEGMHYLLRKIRRQRLKLRLVGYHIRQCFQQRHIGMTCFFGLGNIAGKVPPLIT